MPSSPIASPLKMLVTMNAMPWTVPTRPLAFACRSTGTSSVTVVDSAMLRRFSTTAPSRMIDREHPEPRAAEIDERRFAERDEERAGDQEGDERHEAREHHDPVLAVPVDDGAEQHAEQRDQEHVRAADEAGGEHGPRLEVRPERQREPEEARRDVGDGGVDEHLDEHPHAAGRRER